MSTFEETGLAPELIRAITELGFEHPTPIQEKTIPYLLSTGKDLIANAQTGTGKTAAFGLPLIQQTDADSLFVQSLILCPTRELCVQITKDLTNYSKFVKKLNVVAIYGGESVERQIKSLKIGCQIVVGTPGRVNDMIKRKKLNISGIQWLVLDEADEMLNMGFKEELDEILETAPVIRQTLLFSATMPRAIFSIAEKYMKDPDEITIGKRNTGAETVKHYYYQVQARDKYQALKRLVDINPKIYGIVFCRTRIETNDVAEKLMQDGYNADALHGDLSQAQRDHVMNRFRKKHLQLLVATDVAARGLDVNDLTHIINYTLPDDSEIYLHRSGRTGRAGKNGISISIVHSREMNKIRDIERIFHKKFELKNIPGGKEICEKQLFNLVDTFENVEINEAQIEQFLPVIYKKLDWLSKEDLIKRFISVEFNRFLDYYKDARDLNSENKERPGREQRRDSNTRMSRYYINLGQKNKLTPVVLIGMINDQLHYRKVEIGKIEILRKFSFFEIDSHVDSDLPRAFGNLSFDGIKVILERSEDNSPVYSQRADDRKGKREIPAKILKKKKSFRS